MNNSVWRHRWGAATLKTGFSNGNCAAETGHLRGKFLNFRLNGNFPTQPGSTENLLKGQECTVVGHSPASISHQSATNSPSVYHAG